MPEAENDIAAGLAEAEILWVSFEYNRLQSL